MKLKPLLLTALLLTPLAQAASLEPLEVHNPYARATPPNAPASAAFMMLHNNNDVARYIVSATTPAAETVELHNHVKEGDVMKMRQVSEIEVPANGMATLKPGSLHIMFFDLKKPFAEDDSIELTLTMKNGDTQTITTPIKKVMKGMKHKHKH